MLDENSIFRIEFRNSIRFEERGLRILLILFEFDVNIFNIKEKTMIEIIKKIKRIIKKVIKIKKITTIKKSKDKFLKFYYYY